MLRLKTFGGLSLESDGGGLSGAALQKRRLALLAALAIAGPHGLAREKILGLREPVNALSDQYGDIDIYLFDQLLRGRIATGMRVLDAGCGTGRNLVYLLREKFDIHAIDESAEAIAATRRLAATLAPHLPANRFRVERIEDLSLPAGSVDVVISSAVLHFARDESHWLAMVDALWRVLAPGGLFFARLASTVGQGERLIPLGGRRFLLPDGSDRFLVDDEMLIRQCERLGGTLLDPIKTSVVHGLRSMATWVVRKPGT